MIWFNPDGPVTWCFTCYALLPFGTKASPNSQVSETDGAGIVSKTSPHPHIVTKSHSFQTSLKYVSDFIGSASWTGHPKLLCCSAADQLQRQMCSHCFRATHAQNFFFFTNAQKLLGLNFHQRVPAGLYIPAQLLRAQSHSSPCAAS